MSAVPGVQGQLSSTTPPFAALPTAPAMARAHARLTLAEWHLEGLTDEAEVITSELVTNAVSASADAGESTLVIRVCLLSDGEALTIEVWDQAPGVPVLRNGGPLAESGRGLAIVDDLTRGAWGCQPAIGQRGKCVWAELPLTYGMGADR